MEWIKENAEWVFSGLGIFIATLLGGVAKWLISRCKNKRKHELQEEALQNQRDRLALEQERLRLEMRPNLDVSNPIINNIDRTMMIKLVNYGETAILKRITRLPNGCREIPLNYPYRLENGCNVRLWFRIYGAQNMNTDTISFDVELEDNLHNSYTARVVIDHTGHRVELIFL